MIWSPIIAGQNTPKKKKEKTKKKKKKKRIKRIDLIDMPETDHNLLIFSKWWVVLGIESISSELSKF